MLVASGLFVGLALLAEYEPARKVAIAFAGAVDLAVLMKVLPGSGTSTAITSNSSAQGWAGLPAAGSAAIIPNGSGSGAQDCASSSGSTSTSTSTSTAGLGSSVTSAVAALAKQGGWNATQISDWENVINAESGGNPDAENASSGAYGIAQALGHGTSGTACPSTGRNEYGGYGLTDAQAQKANCGGTGAIAVQLLWMYGYLKQRWGTPSAAWANEQSAHWY